MGPVRFATVLGAFALVAAACGSGVEAGGAGAPVGLTEAQSTLKGFASSSAQGRAWKTFVGQLKNKYEGETLNIVGIDDPWIPAYKKIIPEFEKLTGAKINTAVYSYNDTYSREVLLGNQRDSSQDIFVFDMPWVGKFATSKYVEPLEPYMARTPKNLVHYEDFFASMRDGANWNDQIVGFPFAPYFILNIYNKKLLDQAGVDPPEHLEDLVPAAKALNDKLGGPAAIAMNNQAGSSVGQAYFEYIYNMGGKPFASEHPESEDYYADMTPQFTSKESIAVVKLFKDLLPYQPKGKLNMAWNERFAAFASGKAAMMSPWNYNVPQLGDPKQSAVTKDFVVRPTLHKKDVKLNTPIGGWEMGINRFSKQKNLAWDFIVWFTSPQIGAQFAAIGGYPARYSVQKNPELVKQYPYYATLQKVVDTSFPAFRPQIPESFEVIDTLGTWISKALSGEMSVEAAMARADQEVSTLLEKAGYRIRKR